MPSGKRYRLTLKGIKYDLSVDQFILLAKRSIPLKAVVEWNSKQRIYGLVNKGLFIKRSGSYKRTNLGTKLCDAFAAKP